MAERFQHTYRKLRSISAQTGSAEAQAHDIHRSYEDAKSEVEALLVDVMFARTHPASDGEADDMLLMTSSWRNQIHGCAHLHIMIANGLAYLLKDYPSAPPNTTTARCFGVKATSSGPSLSVSQAYLDWGGTLG